MSTRNLKEFCQLSEGSQELLRIAISELNFSARASDRILKVARTIADLAGRTDIDEGDISEAIQYRTLDRNLWI
jgi:magnesium chelatase family protein